MSIRAKILLALSVALIILYGVFAFDLPYKPPVYTPQTAPATSSADLIFLESPDAGTAIASPVAISGQARGPWYFEAVFPIDIVGADGSTVLGSGQGRAKSDWTTGGFVPFSATVSFDRGSNASGFIRLKKDNPSGDPAKDDRLDIPVVFASSSASSVGLR
jgi:hypothetical protein